MGESLILGLLAGTSATQSHSKQRETEKGKITQETEKEEEEKVEKE